MRLRCNSGFAAGGRLTRYICLTTLHFRSKRSCTYDSIRHSLTGSPGYLSVSKGPVFRSNALVSLVSGSLHQGPGYGLSPPICCACQAHRVATEPVFARLFFGGIRASRGPGRCGLRSSRRQCELPGNTIPRDCFAPFASLSLCQAGPRSFGGRARPRIALTL